MDSLIFLLFVCPSCPRFATRSRRFMDGYRRGLNGKQAAWASRKYHGHRVLPADIFDELKDAGLVTVSNKGN